MEAGTIVEWKLDVGAQVAEGETLLSIETEKSVAEIPAPVGGIIVERRFNVGDEVPVGTVLAYLEEG